MADFSAQGFSGGAHTAAVQEARAADYHFAIGPAALPHFALACFDSIGVRRYWSSPTADFASAPALTGGHTYVTATLVVLGRH